MENCKTTKSRTRRELAVVVVSPPNIKNMPKRDYDIFISTLAQMISDDKTKQPSPFLAEEDDSHD